MRYVKLFLLEFQSVSEQRGVTFVWFILSIFSPLIMILFWRGAQTSAANWAFSTISSYYLLLIISQSLLMSHIEESTARIDIQEGRLSQYLLKPFSYYWLKFLTEIPWRIMQGGFGVIAFVGILSIFKIHITITNSIPTILLSVIISFLGYFIAHTYKMVLGFMAFWTTDTGGAFQLSEMLLFIFGGYIVPLYLYPDVIARIAYMTPAPYIIYYPVAALQGLLSLRELWQVIGVQIIFLVVLGVLYKILWKYGVKSFTGVGQ